MIKAYPTFSIARKTKPFCILIQQLLSPKGRQLHQVVKYKHFSSLNSILPQNVLLCSGQGAQHVGMLKNSYLKYAKVREIVQLASEISGKDLLKLCKFGPKEEIDKTVNCQLLIVLSSLAAMEVLRGFGSFSTEKPYVLAGYSIGELSALALGKSISYEDAFLLVKARAEAMQYASDLTPSGLIFIQGLDHHKIMALCQLSEEEFQSTNGICRVAIEAYEKGFVVGGTKDCLDSITLTTSGLGCSVTKLPVSGAFHTPLMKDAQPAYYEMLKKITFKTPAVPVASNVTGSFFTKTDDIKRLLLDQLVKPVKWKQIVIKTIEKSDNLTFFELGPGKQLKPMIGKINRKLLRNYVNVSV